MICPFCKALNDDAADACFTCGRALGALTRGSVIADRYEILAPLGRGGMGMVYRAHDRMLDETVAIKVLRAEFANTPAMAQRFRHEIKLARRVTHRNVCRIHEYGETDGLRFISMEFVDGVDLRQLAQDRGGVVSPTEALELAIQVAEGLQAIHDVGIIHRDLKASNVMRDTRGVVRLMDFGIAKIEGRHEGSGEQLTSAGLVMGTPEYMSPEQCLGETLDHRSDIYALGILLYELLAGTVPFRGETAVATLFKHIQDPVPYEGTLIPLALIPVFRRALAKNRGDRFDSAQAMAEALRGAGRQSDADAARTTASLGKAKTSTGSQPAVGGRDRRIDTRLDIFVNLILRRVGTLGTVLQEERTIAENVGKGGARVMTAMTSLTVGDIVHLEEVGGPFKTRAEVRGLYVGRDGIRRLNLRFVDSPAPDYLVHIDGA
jgi:serine/threonine protein kinase